MSTLTASDRNRARSSSDLVLASSSPYRRALLKRLTYRFLWRAPAVNETPLPSERPTDLVRRLAIAKARALISAYPNAILIGSDQIAVVDGHTLGKPGTAAHALAQLTATSGRSVVFLTSVCVLDGASKRYELEMVPTTVRFRELNERQICNYIDREQPLDCAGSFKCEGLGIALFESITSSDPSALVGLPLIALTGMLSRAGFDVLAKSP